MSEQTHQLRLMQARLLSEHWQKQAEAAEASIATLTARCEALEREVVRIESEKAAYRTLAELDKASLAERHELIAAQAEQITDLAKALREVQDTAAGFKASLSNAKQRQEPT